MKKDYSILDTNNVYCSHCFKINKITVLEIIKDENKYNICKEHKHLNGNFRTIRFIDGKWEVCRGIAINAKPQKPSMFKKICKQCGNIEIDTRSISVWKCSVCNWIPDKSMLTMDHKKFKYKHKCINDKCSMFGIEVIDNIIPINWRCEKCNTKEKKYFKCEKCGSSMDSSIGMCNNCNHIQQHIFNYSCEKCNTKLSSYNQKCPNCKNVNKVICYKCGNKIKPSTKCEKCGTDYLFNHRQKLAYKNLDRMNINYFTKKDGILFYNGIEWENYKKIFKNNETSTFAECIINKYNGFWQNTYRTTINTRKGQIAMEHELVEKGIHWFVYIKFYKDKNVLKPLVVGKSGSLNVNKSGSDLKFDLYNTENKAGRRFLKENNLNWYKDKIIIIPTKSEKDAYNLEAKISKEYNLFYS